MDDPSEVRATVWGNSDQRVKSAKHVRIVFRIQDIAPATRAFARPNWRVISATTCLADELRDRVEASSRSLLSSRDSVARACGVERLTLMRDDSVEKSANQIETGVSDLARKDLTIRSPSA